MGFKDEEIRVLELSWQDTGNLLTLNMPDYNSALSLTRSDSIRGAIASLAKKLGYKMAKISYPEMGRGLEVLASMAPLSSQQDYQETPMTSIPLTTTTQPPQGFVWFGGVIIPALRPILDRMEGSDEPTGLVEPRNDNSVVKTIQWAINKASVDLFGFDALSMDDMKAAIQRDTSGDWYPDDLDLKRQLYQQSGTRFEQTARIRTKAGWMKVHFQCERTGVGDLVLSRGRQVSEVKQSPELLALT